MISKIHFSPPQAENFDIIEFPEGKKSRNITKNPLEIVFSKLLSDSKMQKKSFRLRRAVSGLLFSFMNLRYIVEFSGLPFSFMNLLI